MVGPMTLGQMADELEALRFKIREVTCGNHTLYLKPAPCIDVSEKPPSIAKMIVEKHRTQTEKWMKSLELLVEEQLRLVCSQNEQTVLLPYAGMQFIPLDIRHEMPEDVHEYRMAKIYYEIPGGYQPKTELQLTNN